MVGGASCRVVVVVVWAPTPQRQRDRETHRHKDRHRQRQRHTHTLTQTRMQTYGHKRTDTDNEKKAQTDTHTHRHTHAHPHTHTLARSSRPAKFRNDIDRERKAPPPLFPPLPRRGVLFFVFVFVFLCFFGGCLVAAVLLSFGAILTEREKTTISPPSLAVVSPGGCLVAAVLRSFGAILTEGKHPPPPWPIAEARHSPTDFACHAIAPATSVFPSGRRDGQSTNTGPAPGPHRVSRRPRPPPQSNRRAKMSHPPGRGSRLTARRQPCSSGTWCSGITPA